MLRLIGKVIAGAAATAATTYLGNKFLHWAGALQPKLKVKHDDLPDVQAVPKDRIE